MMLDSIDKAACALASIAASYDRWVRLQEHLARVQSDSEKYEEALRKALAKEKP